MKLKVLFLSTLFSFGLLLSLVIVMPVQAQGTVRLSDFDKVEEVNTAIDSTYEDSSNINIHSVVEAVDFTGDALLLTKFTGKKNADGTTQEGAISSVGKAIGTIFENSPASGERYVADLLYNMKIGPAQPAYAQVGGLGFTALEPILYAWKQFRNIAYLFFIIITLIIGFMVMMRKKVGQAAVTAQQAIPQIVIALITVTFSYAIAGFMIDLMYVFMYLFVGLFPDQLGEGEGILSKNIFSISLDLFAGVGQSAQDSVGYFVKAQLEESFLDGAAGGLGWISGLTFAIIIAIAYLFAVIQLFFELLKTYIAIIISIVISPLTLMLGALPGNDMFFDWIRGLIGNLIAFPTVLLLIILHKLLTSEFGVEGGFLPPFLMGRGSASAITSLTGLAIMLISKDLVVQAKKVINPKGGGIFDQFGSNLASSVSKGWKGDQLIPGVGFTDTAKIPGIKHFGSGKNILSNVGSTAAGAAGAAWGARTPGARLSGAKVGGTDSLGWASSKLGGTLWGKEKADYEKREKENKK